MRIVAFILTIALAACSKEQLDAATRLVVAIGTDVVNIECSQTAQNTIMVIAADIKASARVQNALAKNAKLATDACPALQSPTIQFLTGAVAVAKAG